MSYRHREIESKWVTVGVRDLTRVDEILYALFADEISREAMGYSRDTYWSIDNRGGVAAQFIRMRERDGIRQITVKGKDKGDGVSGNLDRIEIDVDSTSSPRDITALLTAAHGAPSGSVVKTHYTYWLGDPEGHTTVCAYEVDDPDLPEILIEVETTSKRGRLALEAKVIEGFSREGIQLERAPGSLYEMVIQGVR